MARDPMHKSVCDHCYRGTWYEIEGQACRMSISKSCPCCRSVIGEQPCPGKLRLIDRSGLAPQFASLYESGDRIKVRLSDGEERTGTIGKTMGWKPSYMLLLRSNSRGSSILLGIHDRVIAVKRGDRYMSLIA